MVTKNKFFIFTARLTPTGSRSFPVNWFEFYSFVLLIVENGYINALITIALFSSITSWLAYAYRHIWEFIVQISIAFLI